MSTLQQIRERRTEIAKARQSLDAEDAELATAERVLIRMGNGSQHASLFDAPSPVFDMPVLTSRKITNRDLVVEALSRSPHAWLESSEINGELSKMGRPIIKSATLYPLLTLLKNEGTIVRDGAKLALKARVNGETPTES